MIQDDQQFQQAKRVLDRLETALVALRRKIEPVNQELFRATAQSYLSSIEKVRAEIDDFIGARSADEARAPFWLTLEGERLHAVDISSRLLSEWLSRFRRALQNVAEYLQTHRYSTGRPNLELIELTDPKIVALRQSSIRIGIRLPVYNDQLEMFAQDDVPPVFIAQRSLARILDMVQWVDSGLASVPGDKFPDDMETIVLANQVSALVPSRKGTVQTVRFTGALVPAPGGLWIASDALPRLRRLAASLTETYEDSVEGVVREIDLDAQRIILRERGPEQPDVKCFLPDELVDQAERYLNKHIRVIGLFSSVAPDVVDVRAIEELKAL